MGLKSIEHPIATVGFVASNPAVDLCTSKSFGFRRFVHGAGHFISALDLSPQTWGPIYVHTNHTSVVRIPVRGFGFAPSSIYRPCAQMLALS